jgi:60S ribosomal protein uL30
MPAKAKPTSPAQQPAKATNPVSPQQKPAKAPAAPAKAAAPAKVPAPETKRKRAAEGAKDATELKAKRTREVARRKTKRQLILKRTVGYEKEYRRLQRTLVNHRRVAKEHGNFFAEAEPKVAYVMRIKGIRKMIPKTRKILQLLRLRQINNGVFVKINKASVNMLRRVEPYIAYGYPNLETIRKLVYKRGHVKIDGQRIRIQTNDQVEKALGKHGILSVEDIVHQLYTCGPKFREVSNTLWPFKLSHPNGGFRQKRRHYVEGGDFGNREDLINKMIQRML